MSIMRLSRPCIYLACTLLALLSAVLRAQAPIRISSIGPDATPKLPADACFYATVHVKEIVHEGAPACTVGDHYGGWNRSMGFDPLLSSASI